MDAKRSNQLFAQSGSPDNLYLNCTILGPPAVGTESGVIANFDAMRAQPIISRPSDYYMSIVRMSVPLNSAPIMIVPIAVPPVTTPWVVGIEFNGTYYTDQAVLLQTENFAAAGSFFPQNQIFSYATFVSMINVAMAAAYAVFRGANPGAPQAIANQAPFIIWNPVTELFSWVMSNTWFTAPPAVEPLVAGQARITLNNALLAYLDGFRQLLISTANPNQQASVVFENTGDNQYTLNGFVNTSSTTQTWQAVRSLVTTKSIVVTTASLPIVQEAISTTVPGSSQSNGASQLPIVTDFEIQTNTSSDIRSVVYYTPTAQYRLTDLSSDSPLYRVQLSFFWQAKDGTLSPIVVARNQQVTAKLLFVKKSLYNKVGRPGME